MSEDRQDPMGESPPEATPPIEPGKCPGCGEPAQPTDEFCGSCGMSLVSQPEVTVPESTRTLTAEELNEIKLHSLPPAPIQVAVASATHTGKVKENNEDAVLTKRVDYPRHGMCAIVAILADGMGGYDAGEVFGEIAVAETWAGLRFHLPFDEQQQRFEREDFWKFLNRTIADRLAAVMTATNRRVLNTGRAKQLKDGKFGATTVVTVIACDLERGRIKVHGYNEGDARCGVVLDGRFNRLSTDQTVMGFPNRYLGKNDTLGGKFFDYEIWMSEASTKGFWVLLYSDGLWNMLSDDQMINTSSRPDDPTTLCDLLVQQAVEVEVPYGLTLGDDKVKPADDNITVAAFRCHLSEKESQ